jgi:hypothetical protein
MVKRMFLRFFREWISDSPDTTNSCFPYPNEDHLRTASETPSASKFLAIELDWEKDAELELALTCLDVDDCILDISINFINSES